MFKGDGKRIILPVSILFDGKAETIIKRYLKDFPDIPTDFPPLAATMNEKIKELARMTKIPKRLDFHTARHTCRSLLAEKTGNPFIIMQILGHLDIDTSMNYIHHSTSGITNHLSKTKW